MKQKVLSILAILMMALTAQAATTITWDAAKLTSMRTVIQSTEPASQSKTSDGITVTVAKTVSSAYYYTMEFGSDIMANTQGYFTFESSVGNISKIEINQTGGGRWRSGGTGWNDDFADFSSTPFTWSGTPAASVTLTGKQGDRLTTISSIVFTIEEPTPAVTLTDGNDLSALSAYAGKEVDITYTRSFTADQPSTVCLPFAYTPKAGEGFYGFGGISKVGDDYLATYVIHDGALVANTPYLYLRDATGDTDFSGTYTLPSSITAGETTDGDWKFYGTYTTLTYGTDPFSGNVYGFAAQAEGDNVQAGEFVKATTGATVPPMRCYLKYKDGAQYSASRSFDGSAGSDALPQTIIVRLVDLEGNVTSIGAINTRTSEFTADGWYTLDGHRLLGKPSKKGLYINNGKKVIIK